LKGEENVKTDEKDLHPSRFGLGLCDSDGLIHNRLCRRGPGDRASGNLFFTFRGDDHCLSPGDSRRHSLLHDDPFGVLFFPRKRIAHSSDIKTKL